MRFTQGHALLIGVGSYRYAPRMDVPVTVADMRALADVLRDPQLCAYPEEQVALLYDEAATKEAMLCMLYDLASRTTPADTCLLFYCGHGVYGDDGQYYLTTHDTRVVNGRVTGASAVSQVELLTIIKALRVRRALLIFNACHAGAIVPTLGAGDAVQGANLPDITATALLATGEGRMIITACRDNQFSHIGDGNLTIFTQALIDGLRGKGITSRRGYISVFDLYTATYDTVRAAVQESYGQRQEPELTVHKGVGPFAVALFQGAAAQGDLEAGERPDVRTAVREVSPKHSQRLYEQIVRGGVAFGSGNIGTIGGDIVGGDQRIGGDNIGGNKIGGDSAGRDINKPQNTFTISGSINAGLVNVGGTVNVDVPLSVAVGDKVALSDDDQSPTGNMAALLKQAVQRIGALPGADSAAKHRLVLLLEQLHDSLRQAPPDRTADVEKIARRTQVLIDEACRPDLDRELLVFNGESLKQAAAAVERSLPVATQLVIEIAASTS